MAQEASKLGAGSVEHVLLSVQATNTVQLFIIEGAITIVVAAAAFFILPNFPRTTLWLTEEERQLAVWRLQEDIGFDDFTNTEEQRPLNGFKMALADSKTWLLMLILTCVVSSARYVFMVAHGYCSISYQVV